MPVAGEPWRTVVWAPGGALVQPARGETIPLRPLAERIGSAAELGRRLALPEDLPDALRSPVLAQLAAGAAIDARLLLVASDQPEGVEERHRRGDTLPMTQLLAAAVRGGHVDLGRRFHILPVRVSAALLGLNALVAELLDHPLLANLASVEEQIHVVHGGGPGPLQLAVAVALAGTLTRTPAQIAALLDREQRTVVRPSGLSAVGILRAAGPDRLLLDVIRDRLAVDDADAARALLNVLADHSAATRAPGGETLEDAAALVDLAWRLEQCPGTAQEREELAARLESVSPDLPGAAGRERLAEALAGGPDAYLGVRVHRAVRLAQAGDRALARVAADRIERWLGRRADVPAEPLDPPAEGWSARLAERVPAGLRPLLETDVVAGLLGQARVHLNEAAAAGPDRPARTAVAFALGNLGPAGLEAAAAEHLEVLAELLSAASVTADVLVLLGTRQDPPDERDTFARAEALREAVIAERDAGSFAAPAVVETWALGAPGSLEDTVPALELALASELRAGDLLVVLQHGGAPALAQGALLAACRLGIAVELWRSSPSGGPPIDVPFSEVVRRTRARAVRRHAAGALAGLRAVAGLEALALAAGRTAPATLARAAAMLEEAANRSPGEHWAQLRWARARAELVTGRPDDGLLATAALVREAVGSDRPPAAVTTGSALSDIVESSLASPPRAEAIRLLTGARAAGRGPALHRQLDVALRRLGGISGVGEDVPDLVGVLLDRAARELGGD